MLDKEQRVLMKDSTVLNEKANSLRSLCFQLRCGEWNGEETRSEAYVFLRIGSHGGNDCRTLLMFTMDGSPFTGKQDHLVQTSSIGASIIWNRSRLKGLRMAR